MEVKEEKLRRDKEQLALETELVALSMLLKDPVEGTHILKGTMLK